MEFRDLKYFQKLVETKNYNRTAEFFGVTQPAISSMVKRLEKEIGTQLIFQAHNHKRMTISPADLWKYLLIMSVSTMLGSFVFWFGIRR